LQTAENRFEAGTVEKFAVLQARVALANARPALVSARAAYKLAIDRLRSAAGLAYPPGLEPGAVRLTAGWPAHAAPGPLDTALANAAATRPELAAATARAAALRRALEAELARTRPQVSANAGYGLQGRSFGSDTFDDPLFGWFGGVEVRVPLFDPGLSRGRRELAEARIETADADIRRQRVAIEAEVRQAWLALDEAREIIESSALVVEQAEEAIRLARAAFDAGTGTQLDVLESRLALTRASLTRLEATSQLHQAAARLRRASGQAP
jgi:outer membrane protein